MTLEVFTPHGGSVVSGIGPYPVLHPYGVGGLQVFTDQGGQLVALAPGEWSVVPAESDTGGNVFLTAPVAVREDARTLYIRRATQVQQGWQGTAGEREAGLEAQLDAMAMALQEARRDTDRGLRVATGVIPALAPRPSTVLGFNAAGQPVLIDQASFEIGPGMLLLMSGAPTGALGKDGDLCIVAATGNLHSRAAGVWTLVGNLAGPPGPPTASTPYMATVLAAADAATARSALGLEIGVAVQAASARLAELAGLTGPEGTLAVRNAAGQWVALPPGAPLAHLRRNAAGNGYEFVTLPIAPIFVTPDLTGASFAEFALPATGFRGVRFVFYGVGVATSGAGIAAVFSRNNGVSYDNGPTDYRNGTTNNSAIFVSFHTLGNLAHQRMDGECVLLGYTDAVKRKRLTGVVGVTDTTNDAETYVIGGLRQGNSDPVTNVRFVTTSGAFGPGFIAMYGIV